VRRGCGWLRGWLSLLKKSPQTLEETFDEVLANKGTGQDGYQVLELRPSQLAASFIWRWPILVARQPFVKMASE
jgi:hypothetical protein